MRPHRRLLLRGRRPLLGLALVTAVAACDSSPNLPLLTDPHEILTAAATSTAALGSLHLQLELAGRDNGGRGGQDQVRIQLEADIDMQRRNLTGRSQLTMGDAPGNAGTGEFVVVDGSTFTRDSTTPRWSMNENAGAGAHLPTNAEYLALIEAAVANGSAVLALADASPCGAGTCYHVSAALDANATWRLIAAPLVGDRTGVGSLPRGGMVPAPSTLEIYVDQKTRLLAGLTGSFAIATTGISFTITVSNHDLPIRIAPPQLLENPNQGGEFPPPPEPPSQGP